MKRRLTTTEKEFLEDNIDEIKTEIKKRTSNNVVDRQNLSMSLADRIDDALSMSVLAIQEYDPQKGKDKIKFIAERSVLRLKDEERKQVFFSRDTIRLKKLVNKIENGDASWDEFGTKRQKSMRLRTQHNVHRLWAKPDDDKKSHSHCSFDLSDKRLIKNANFNAAEWEDTIRHIREEARHYFSNKKHQDIYLDLIDRYITTAEGYEQKIKDIAEKFGYSQARIYQLLSDGCIKSFFNQLDI